MYECKTLGQKLGYDNAQANGQVEAANKNIISIIKRKTKRKPKNWHEVLGEALWACRTSPKHSLGFGA